MREVKIVAVSRRDINWKVNGEEMSRMLGNIVYLDLDGVHTRVCI